MKISLAHLNIQSINVAVFDARPSSTSTAALNEVLSDLTAKARLSGLRVDKSALAYSEGGGIKFWGTPDLVEYLASSGLPRWTHTIDA